MPATPAEARPDAGLVPKTLREQGGLAAALALIAGYVDAHAYLNYKSYASFMSGNTTQTGLQTGLGKLASARHDLLPILAFVVGVFAGTLLLHAGSRRPHRWLFASVAALLVGSLAGGATPGTLPGWLGIVLLSVAMGAMNTTITRVGAQSVSLGYGTGCLNNLTQHLVLAMRRLPVPHAQGAWDTHGRRAALLAGIWAAFLLSALLGGAMTSRLATWTLLPPILVLAALAAFGRGTDEWNGEPGFTTAEPDHFVMFG